MLPCGTVRLSRRPLPLRSRASGGGDETCGEDEDATASSAFREWRSTLSLVSMRPEANASAEQIDQILGESEMALPIRVVVGEQTVVLRPFHDKDEAMVARNASPASLWLSLRDRVPHPYTLADARDWISFCKETYAESLQCTDDGWRVGDAPHALFLAIAVQKGDEAEDECVGSVSLTPYR